MSKRKTSDSPPPRSSNVNKRVKSESIKAANALDVYDFHRRYIDQSLLTYQPMKEDKLYNINLTQSALIPSEQFEQCFNLIQETSHKDYARSSWGWHATRKRREMREPDMRYLLVRQRQGSIDGFLSFMLTHDSTPVVPVLYIYEIHLRHSVRSHGLGRHLMRLADSIAQNVGVEKIMLTCFKSNAQALNFYRRGGFEVDDCSPEDRSMRTKMVKVDYVILSKEMPSKVSSHARSRANVLK